MSLLAFAFAIVCPLLDAAGGNSVGFEMDVRMGLARAFPAEFAHHPTEHELRELRQKIVELRRRQAQLRAQIAAHRRR